MDKKFFNYPPERQKRMNKGFDNLRDEDREYIKQNVHKWPKSVEEAVRQLILSLDEQTKQDLAHASNIDEVYDSFLLLMTIRAKFGLWWHNEKLLRDCGDGQMVHPDDASGFILEMARQQLRRESSE